MRVTVVGLGYVGLVTAAGLAEWGHDVLGVEIDARRLSTLLAGRVPLHEPGLQARVTRHIESGALRFTTDAAEAVAASHLTMLAVGTTDGEDNWQTAPLLACLADIVPQVADDGALVVRSTVPPEFVRRLEPVVESLRNAAGRPPIPVLLNPEFTREGSALRDFLDPDRVVVGVASDPAGRGVGLLRRLYRSIEAPFLVMSAVDAAVSKLGANLFLATKIAFANELAAICDSFGATIDEVVGAMALDPRIGGSYLRAGVGFGGSCLPHQVRTTARAAAARGVPNPLLAAVAEINDRQRSAFVGRIADLLGGDLAGRRIAMLGLTFKPDTDDLRDAPSLTIARLLLDQRASVIAFDPIERACQRAVTIVPGLEIATSPEGAIAGADAVALVTEWPQFAAIDWAAAAATMREPILVDGRNALSPEALISAGFTYTAFGRGWHTPAPQPMVAADAGLAGLALLKAPVTSSSLGAVRPRALVDG